MDNTLYLARTRLGIDIAGKVTESLNLSFQQKNADYKYKSAVQIFIEDATILDEKFDRKSYIDYQVNSILTLCKEVSNEQKYNTYSLEFVHNDPESRNSMGLIMRFYVV